MNLEQAKGAYGLIIAIAQLGAIIGSTIATKATLYGIPQLFLVGAMSVFCVSLLIKIFFIIFKPDSDKSNLLESSVSSTISVDDIDSYEYKFQFGEQSADGIYTFVITSITRFSKSISYFFGGFYEGLILILRYKYTLKLLGISCLYEVVVTVLDYEFKILGAGSVSLSDSNIVDGNRFAILLGHFGQFTNLISFLISLFGFTMLVRHIGVKFTLLIFPMLLFVAVVAINLVPTLWVLFVLVSLIKALIFSLNDPVKELLYNPTSDAIKFKAKAWIDVFGSRFAKGAGSFITNLSGGDATKLRTVAEIPCLVISLGVFLLAWSIGDEFTELVQSKTIVGKDVTAVVHLSEVSELYLNLPERNGLRPGDVGYDGYDPQLFDGVFPEEVKD